MTKTSLISLSSLVMFLLSPSVWAVGKLTPQLSSTIPRQSPTDHLLTWVSFVDKGRNEALRSRIPHSVVSRRSLLRRQKVQEPGNLVDYTDLPVERSYVDELAATGVIVRHQSKWFNCVSVVATTAQIQKIAALPFVVKLDLVWRAQRAQTRTVEVHSPASLPPRNRQQAVSTLDYGLSFNQVQLINVPAVHNTGNSGQGVLIGVFDNGFRLLNHEAFDSLRTRIVATYDFVDHKLDVAPNNPDPGFGSHGIVTLSALAGFKPGNLIGPAFGASFILARTENDSSETPIEEDNWVAAIEWADSIGVDVTSTSLGYLDYNAPHPGWTWEDMDGNTTLITRAADMAVGKGIIVVNSAGNNGFNASRNTLNAPADGDSVITVGAVTLDGIRASFSSVGPTTSTPARIKPDIMASGTTIRCASPTNPNGYTYQQGTSLACPLAAGVAALVLHARPSSTPLQIANLMRSTGTNAGAPDNLVGWGIIDALAATIGYRPVTFPIGSSYPNPFPTPSNPSTTLPYLLTEQSRVTIEICSILGQRVRTLVNAQQQAGQGLSVSWDGKNDHGSDVASGVYFGVFNIIGASGTSFFETFKITLIR